MAKRYALILAFLLTLPALGLSQSRWTTDSFTSDPVSASGTLVVNRDISSSFVNIGKIKVTPSNATGSSAVKLFKKDTCLDADQVYRGTFTSVLIDPVQRVSGVQTESNEWLISTYEDLDGTSELHIKIWNDGAITKTYDFEITYEPIVTRTKFSITEYGAAGDGVTDDIDAVERAEAAAAAAGRGIVTVPYGRYYLSRTWSIDNEGIRVLGEGQPIGLEGSTPTLATSSTFIGSGITIIEITAKDVILDNIAVSDPTGSADTIGVLVTYDGNDHPNRVVIRNSYICGSYDSKTTSWAKLGVGVKFVGMNYGWIIDSTVKGFEYGVIYRDHAGASLPCTAGLLDRVKVENCDYGVYLPYYGPALGSHPIWIRNSVIQAHTYEAVYIRTPNVYMSGTHIEAFTGNSPTALVHVLGGGSLSSVGNFYYHQDAYDSTVPELLVDLNSQPVASTMDFIHRIECNNSSDETSSTRSDCTVYSPVAQAGWDSPYQIPLLQGTGRIIVYGQHGISGLRLNDIDFTFDSTWQGIKTGPWRIRGPENILSSLGGTTPSIQLQDETDNVFMAKALADGNTFSIGHLTNTSLHFDQLGAVAIGKSHTNMNTAVDLDIEDESSGGATQIFFVLGDTQSTSNILTVLNNARNVTYSGIDSAGRFFNGSEGGYLGSQKYYNTTSGSITLTAPASGALGSSIITLPIGTGTLAINEHVPGNFGVGMTSTPSDRFQVSGSGHRFTLTDSGDSENIRAVAGHSDGNGGYFFLYTDNELATVVFRSYGDSYILSNNFGIHTYTPEYPFEAAGAANFTDEVRMDGSMGTAGQVLTSAGSGTPAWKYPGESPTALSESADAVVITAAVNNTFTFTPTDDDDGFTATITGCAAGRTVTIIITNNGAVENITYGTGLTADSGSTTGTAALSQGSGDITEIGFRCTGATTAYVHALWRETEP